MRKKIVSILALLSFLIVVYNAYAQPYLCGSTGLIYSDQNFCNTACGATCQDLISQTNGTSYACPSSGYEGFVYDPSTGYTYAVTTNTGFWTSFDNKNNDPSLAIISGATTNQILESILNNYGISQAWIGAYDSSMSTSYNTVDPQNYVWWNNAAISYSNWVSGQPYNLLNSNDIGVVPTQGNHWAYMSSSGTWSADGYHYNYPSSQNYAPYYNALVQWNGPLSCVNGAPPASSPITNPDITNTVNQYCNGQTNCYMCTDTSQCTPQNECTSGYTYNSTNNDCEAQATCPAGGTLDPSTGSCTAPATTLCPTGYTYNQTNKDCEASLIQGCIGGGTISNGQCILSPTNSCPNDYTYNSTNKDCEATPSAQCSTGDSEVINGQYQCATSPNYTCPDSQYVYNTLVSQMCAAQPSSVQCPSGGSYSNGQCVSTGSNYICPGYGVYNSTLGKCTINSTQECPSGTTYNPSTGECQAAPTLNTPNCGSIDNSSNGSVAYTWNASLGLCQLTNYSPSIEANLYLMIENRLPDLNGLEYWTNGNMAMSNPPTYNDILSYITSATIGYQDGTVSNPPCGSTDYSEMSGCPTVDPETGSTYAEEIMAMYVWYLNRCPDPSGYQGWCGGGAFENSGSTLAARIQYIEYGAVLSGECTTTISQPTFGLECSTTPGTCRKCQSESDACPCPNSLFTAGYSVCTVNPYYSDGACYFNANNQCPSGTSMQKTPNGYYCVSCSSGTTYNSSTGECQSNPINICPSGYTMQNNICVSSPTTQTCAVGYTLNNGSCTAPPTSITCPGSGTYSNAYGYCIEQANTSCPSGFTYNSSDNLCLLPASITCPGSGSYNTNKNMCSTSSELTCLAGYTMSNGQCTAPLSSVCPGSGSYNTSENMCSIQLTGTENNCPTGYTYTGNTCVANSTCPSPGSYDTTEQACSEPLQPCSPTSNDMAQCTQTSSGWLCPLSSAVCTTQNGNVNQFTNGGIVSPGVYGGGGTWISTSGGNGIYNGYMSFYNDDANLPAGTYEIGCAADDEGWLYVNGQYLGNCFISSVSSYPYNSNGGLTDITLALTNSCPNCPLSGNPSGVYAQVVNSSGQTVLTTSTSWQASLNPSVFGYAATCPSGYTYNSSYNACTAPISSSNWNPSGTQPAPVYVSSQNYINWTGTPYSVYGGANVPNGYVSYYETTYYALTTMTVPVTLCADDNGILYINDNEITSHSTGGSANYCSTVTTTIPAGTNIIEVSLVNDDSGYNGPNPTAMSVVINGTSLSNWNGADQPGVLWTVYPFASLSSQACPSGGNYSLSGNYCYATANVSFVDSVCPLGNYQCLPNGQGGYSCSTQTCANVSTSTVQQSPVSPPNSITNNGTITNNTNNNTNNNNGCIGTVYIFNGQTFDCRLPGIEDGFSNCCSSSKDWLGLGNCWQNEKELAEKRAAGFCHYVGTYCTAKFLGICLQKDQAYCCFQGVLARIVQEQARENQSLPISGWGSAKNPDCIGFTPTQFQEVDWSKINLSEYYSYLQQNVIGPAVANAENAATQSQFESNYANKIQTYYQPDNY